MLIKPAIDYLNFRYHAKSRHGFGIHSPFVYDLFTRVLMHENDRALEQVMNWQRSLLRNTTKIETGGWGAGSRKGRKDKRTVSELARVTGIKPRFGRLLYLLAKEFGFSSVLELGTGIGISTAYLRNALPNAEFYTVEGSAEKIAFVKNEFTRMNWTFPEFVNGDFDAFLDNYTPSSKPLLAFVDGNHSYEPTMKYFRLLQNLTDEGSVLVFDDIYWSEDMKEAWKDITLEENTIVSIDMYHMGMVFYRKGLSKEKFLINY